MDIVENLRLDTPHLSQHKTIQRLRFALARGSFPQDPTSTMVSTSQIQNLTDSTLVRAFVTADCGRGTIDILWSCLTAIFLSIWTVIHLPVPCFDIERPDNSRTKIVRSRTRACVMALLAPELLLYFATNELMGARQTKTALQRLSIDLSLTHAFFFNMGGFCLKSPIRRCHQLRCCDIKKATKQGTLLHTKE